MAPAKALATGPSVPCISRRGLRVWRPASQNIMLMQRSDFLNGRLYSVDR